MSQTPTPTSPPPPRARSFFGAVAGPLVALLVGGTALGAPIAPASPAFGEPVDGEVIVRFRPGTTTSERAAAVGGAGAHVVTGLGSPGVNLVEGPSPALVGRLEADDSVLWAEPNLTGRWEAVPNDPLFIKQWGLHNTGQGIPDSDGPDQRESSGVPDADIDAPEAWERTTGDPKVIVAVTDSGVAYDHPDLAPAIWRNPGENGAGKEANGVDDDGNGLIDDAFGWDFDENDNDPRDLVGHGTQVAGVIGARGGDAAGVTGVNQRVTIMPLKTGGDVPNSAAIAAAFAYAARNGAKVVNASFTVPPSQAISDAIAAAPKVLFVIAAGNQGSDVETPNGATFPCTSPAPNVICVASTDQNDVLAQSSNRGAKSVDLAAPGVTVWTTRVASSQPVFEGWVPPDELDWRTNGNWTRVTLPDNSVVASDSPGVNYPNNSDTAYATNVGFSTQGQFGCTLRTTLFLDVPSPDVLALEAAALGAPFRRLSVLSGASQGFEEVQTRLTGLDNSPSVFLRYRLVSDGAVTGDGAAIKFVVVQCVSTTYRGSEFTPASGTSFASPMTAGVAALAWALAPGATVAQVRRALLEGVDPIPGLAGATVTGGRLNAARTLSKIAAALPPGGAAAVTRLKVLSARLAPGRRAVLRVRCPAVAAKGCRGLLTLTSRAAKARAGRAAARARVLGKARYSLRAGRTRVVTLRLSPAAPRLLRVGARKAVVVLKTTGARPGVARVKIIIAKARR